MVFICSNIDSKNRSVSTLFWCFLFFFLFSFLFAFFFVHCNAQVCSFLIVESPFEFALEISFVFRV